VSDLKLFRIQDGKAAELQGNAFAVEVSLQRLIENNMETLFGVRFLETEHSTGAKHRGRIDSLGIDENVINQGLFYLDWLLDHQGEFKLLVMRKLGAQAAEEIDWRNPRLVCVAGAFNRYDEHAIMQMNRSIELVQYRDFDGELLALELVASRSGAGEPASSAPSKTGGGTAPAQRTVTESLAQAPQPLADLYGTLEAFIEGLGDDVTKKVLKFYFAFRRIKNFACVEIHPRSQTILVYVKVDPAGVELEEGFSRDVRNIGHYGTGDLELRIRTQADLEKALPLIQLSYEAS
jgi:predicted transport protein